MHSLWVHDVNILRNLVTEHHWTNTSILFADNFWKNDQVVTTDGSEFHVEGVLVMVSTILLIVGYQLLSMYRLADQIFINEGGKPLGVRSMLEMEVQSLAMILISNIDDLVCCVMLQNHLLQEQECSFVVDSLSDLDA